MTYSINIQLTQLAVKYQDGFMDEITFHVDCSEEMNVSRIKTALAKYRTLREKDPEKYDSLIRLIKIIEISVDDEFTDDDFNFEIPKDCVGTACKFTSFLLIINQLLIMEIA